MLTSTQSIQISIRLHKKHDPSEMPRMSVNFLKFHWLPLVPHGCRAYGIAVMCESAEMSWWSTISKNWFHFVQLFSCAHIPFSLTFYLYSSLRVICNPSEWPFLRQEDFVSSFISRDTNLARYPTQNGFLVIFNKFLVLFEFWKSLAVPSQTVILRWWIYHSDI